MSQEKVPEAGTFFRATHSLSLRKAASSGNWALQMRDKSKMNQMTPARPRRMEDGLGPNSDIGAKLRALYGQVQDEGIPDKFLDLLEKLAAAEEKNDAAAERK